MKINKIILLFIFALNSLYPQGLWINTFSTLNNKKSNIKVSLGLGKTLLKSSNGKLIVDNFTITSPTGNKTTVKILEKNKPIDISNKINTQGVYSIDAHTKSIFYTKYIDNNNKQQLKLKTKDEIKNIKKIISSIKFETYTKSYLTIGEWDTIKAQNKGLEIIPKTNLSGLKMGDIVNVNVLFNGKPLTITPGSIEYITINSTSFSKNNDFSLFSYIINGKAQFKILSNGQYIINCYHKENITNNNLKYLYEKVNQVYYGTTLSFNVKGDTSNELHSIK